MQELDKYLDTRDELNRHCGACQDNAVLRLRSIEGYALFELIKSVEEIEKRYRALCQQNKNK